MVFELFMLPRACSSLCPGFSCSPQVSVTRLESHFPHPCLFTRVSSEEEEQLDI